MNLWHAGAGVVSDSDGQLLPTLRFGYARRLGQRTSIHGRLDTLALINDLDLFVRYRLLDTLGLDLGVTTLNVLVPGQYTWMLGPRLGLWSSMQWGEFVLGAGMSAALYTPCVTGAWANADPPRPSCFAPVLRPQIVLGVPWWQNASFDIILGAQLGIQNDGLGYSALELGLGLSW